MAENDEIIELTEIVEDSPFLEPDTGSAEMDIMELDDTESDSPNAQDSPSVGSVGETEIPDVSSNMIEAALERVIEKKFSGKIETILFEVMERMIEKEIKEIKESLQKDLDQIGSD